MTKDLTQGSPMKQILSFSLPLLAGLVFQQLYNLTDTMIVGRFLGVQALAGVGATGSINFFVLGFCMGVCSGYAIPVAQQFGARQESQMRRFVSNGIWASIVFCAVITLLTVTGCRFILTWMNTPPDCFEQAYGYIVIIFAGIPFIFLYNLLSGYMRSLGDSRTPLFFLVFSSLLNVALDLLFILLFGWGISGAALATVVSQAVSGLLCIVWMVRKFSIFHMSREEWRFDAAYIRELCRYGIPMGLQYSVTAIGSVILQVAVNGLGSLAVAAATAGGKVLNFVTCPFDALGATLATYGAQNVGANRYDRLDRGVIDGIVIGAVYSLVALAGALLFGRAFAGLFISGAETAELLDKAQQCILANVFFYVPLTLLTVMRYTIQGIGFSMVTVMAGVMEMIARVVTALIFVPLLGFSGAVMGSPLAWILADLVLIPVYFKCRRILISSAHTPEAPEE